MITSYIIITNKSALCSICTIWTRRYLFSHHRIHLHGRWPKKGQLCSTLPFYHFLV